MKDSHLQSFYDIFSDYEDQKKLIRLRKHVNQLFYLRGWSKNSIVKELGVSKHFVVKWTQAPFQDFSADRRGWPSGRRRKWTQETQQRICDIYTHITNDPSEFYYGATAIAHKWRQWYAQKPPPLRTIGQLMKDLGLSKSHKPSRTKGAARYLCYPEHTIYGGSLGSRVLEADFIVNRYIKGHSTPLHFIGFSAKKAPCLRYFTRITGLTTQLFLHNCDYFFYHFEEPNALKIDNFATFIGSKSGKRSISSVVIYLLQHQVYPIFSVPRRPFSQASIEGNNSVFSRNFWNRRTFTSVDDVDTQLEWFNAASLRYSAYTPPVAKKSYRKDFVPRIYFLRQVRERDADTGLGCIEVLNDIVTLPSVYINFFVIAEWNLSTETLTVSIEQEKSLHTIKQTAFKINKRSKEKLKQSGALSFCI